MSSEQWRVGRTYGIHVYADDRPVATFHRAEDADRAVDAVKAASRVHDLIAHMDSGVVSVAALRHALTGTPMPDGADETAAIEARIAALLAHRAELREAAREAVARWIHAHTPGRTFGLDWARQLTAEQQDTLRAMADELLSLPAVRAWAGEQS